MSITYRFVCRFSFVFFIFLFAFALTQLSLLPLAAQEGEQIPSEDDECRGLDIVLLIDQSDSMQGNDYDEFRIASVHSVINQLGQHRLYFCPEVVHRVGVISFGDTEQLNDGISRDLPFTEIKPDVDVDEPNASLKEWQNERGRLQAMVRSKNLDGTDYIPAFAEAEEMFSALPSLGTEPRMRALILLTDGGACDRESGCFGEQDDQFPVGEYLDELKTQIEQDFPFDGEEEQYYLWVIAMQDDKDGAKYLNIYVGNPTNQTYGEYWEEIAGSHGGDLVRLSQNRENIPATFFEILTRLIGTGNVKELQCGPNYVEPYTEYTIFTIFKNNPSVKVTIESPSEVLISDSTVNPEKVGKIITDHILDDYIEQYVIYKPDPGVWNISSDCNFLKMYREIYIPVITLIEPKADLPLYDVPPFYDSNAPHYLTYKITELRTGEPFPGQDEYPLDVKVDITAKDGRTFAQKLSESNSEGVFRSTEPLPVGELGQYKIVLTGETTSVETKSPLEIFSDEDFYNVYTEMKEFHFEIVEPQSDQIMPLNEPGGSEILPVPVELRLMDGDGNPLDPARVFTGDSTTWFDVTLTDQDGKSFSATVTSDAADPSLLTTSIEGDMSEGAYTLQVQRTGDYREDRYEPKGGNQQKLVPLRRLRTEYFKFKIVEPQEGEMLSLNVVGGGSSRLIPFDVKVQLVDLSDQILDPAMVFEDASGPFFNATLYGPGGSAIGSTNLNSDDTAGPGHFSVELPGQDVKGEYRVEVELIDKPTQPRYHPEPEGDLQDVSFTGVTTEPFNFQILEPTPNTMLPIHESGRGCVVGNQVYPSVAVQLMSENGQYLDKAQLQDVLDGAKSAPFATLVAPDGTENKVELKLMESSDGPRLVGDAESIPELKGEYKFEVFFSRDMVSPQFAALDPTQRVVFSRSDSPTTNPMTCRGAVGLTGSIILSILGIIGWLLVGGPSGTLSLVRVGDAEDIQAGPWQLRSTPRWQTKSNQQLEGLGIKKIQIWNTKPDDPNATRAIRVKVTYLEGEGFQATLNSDEYPQAFTSEVDFLYK